MAVLQELQQRYTGAVDDEIKRWLSHERHSNPFYGMMLYALGYVNERFEPDPQPGGKRFRPALSLAACEAVSDSWHDALTLAAAIELLHNFSLIHDDIEDRDPVRRHRPTVWRLWGEALAINAGDTMFAISGRAAAHAADDPAVSLALLQAFSDTALRLTHGQYLDMSFEGRLDVGVAEYVEMISLKTGSLIAFALWSGATRGGAPAHVANELEIFGLELGRAFQIYDDVAGIWAPAGRTGKVEAKDIQNRKKTLPVLLAFESASSSQIEALNRYYRGNTSDDGEVLEVLDSLRIQEATMTAGRRHLDAALQALERAHLRRPAAEEMTSLAYELTGQ